MADGDFHTTRWSVVARATTAEPATAAKALGELCEIYWLPLYAFARRSGRDDATARDLVQSFCVQLLDNGGLDRATADLGRFRNYLLGAFDHFVANQRRRDGAGKRGGRVLMWSWDDAMERYDLAARDEPNPRQAFERQWALTVLDQARQRLRSENEGAHKRAVLQALEPHLVGDGDRATTARVALDLGSTDGAVRVALHRLRTRLRELIRDEVAQTVADASEIEDELRHLRGALAAPDDGRFPAADR